MFETKTFFCGQEEFLLTRKIDREKERQKGGGGGGGKQKKENFRREREIRDLKTKKIAYFHE